MDSVDLAGAISASNSVIYVRFHAQETQLYLLL